VGPAGTSDGNAPFDRSHARWRRRKGRAARAPASSGVADLSRRWATPGRLAVAGALTIAFSAILVRLADVAPSTAAVFRCAYAVPVLAVLAARERVQFGPRDARERRLAAYAGGLFAADLILWHHAIADVGAGLATVLGNLQVVLVGFVAWVVLGERPERRLVAAIPVVLSGVVLISGVVGAAFGRDPARGVVFGVLTAVAYSGFILLLRQAGRDLRRRAGPLLDATAVATLAALPAGALLGELDLTPGWRATAWLVLLALSSQVVGWLLISVSLPRLPAAVTSVLLTIQPVGSVLLAALLLGEEPSALQIAGVALVFCGIAIATARRPAIPTSLAPDAPRVGP
jgi:drug/metabolite transporter (DMT)-like permease